MIDGSCYSACTLVTALVPRDKICITERAMLGFHAGWFENKAGERVTSPTGTRVLYDPLVPVGAVLGTKSLSKNRISYVSSVQQCA
jgi:hypothetical protein